MTTRVRDPDSLSESPIVASAGLSKSRAHQLSLSGRPIICPTRIPEQVTHSWAARTLLASDVIAQGEKKKKKSARLDFSDHRGVGLSIRKRSDLRQKSLTELIQTVRVRMSHHARVLVSFERSSLTSTQIGARMNGRTGLALCRGRVAVFATVVVPMGYTMSEGQSPGKEHTGASSFRKRGWKSGPDLADACDRLTRTGRVPNGAVACSDRLSQLACARTHRRARRA